ncbi:hypothetical protein GQ53DRAFT_746553 [Thozetella sp. PMI_491]|nr:hypothetical protein GQ53DRAFT_746553 [Thozetella sp. PMI_491]
MDSELSPAPAGEKAYFDSLPWCAALLGSPGVVAFAPFSRDLERAGGDELFGQSHVFRGALGTENTIPNYIGLFQDPSSTSPPLSIFQPGPSGDGLEFMARSAAFLVDLRPGINGYKKLAHGGITLALMDDAMGNFLALNLALQNRYKSAHGALPPGARDFSKWAAFTMGLQVKLRSPLVTPQVVVVVVHLEKAERKRLHIRTIVKSESGSEFATCESTWAHLPGKL